MGASAMPRAEPKAVWSKKIDITKDFIDGGAFVKAYSSPVILARISEIPMKKYAGVWTATWTWFGMVISEAGQASGAS